MAATTLRAVFTLSKTAHSICSSDLPPAPTLISSTIPGNPAEARDGQTKTAAPKWARSQRNIRRPSLTTSHPSILGLHVQMFSALGGVVNLVLFTIGHNHLSEHDLLLTASAAASSCRAAAMHAPANLSPDHLQRRSTRNRHCAPNEALCGSMRDKGGVATICDQNVYLNYLRSNSRDYNSYANNHGR